MKVQILLLVFGFAAAMVEQDAPEGKLINRLYATIFHI